MKAQFAKPDRPAMITITQVQQKDTFMENVYTSYTKKIQTTTYYFVKKFVVFPELNNVPPVLEGYGMHTDFDKACEIAFVKDISIKKQLLEDIETGGVQRAKVIDFSETAFKAQKAAYR